MRVAGRLGAIAAQASCPGAPIARSCRCRELMSVRTLPDFASDINIATGPPIGGRCQSVIAQTQATETRGFGHAVELTMKAELAHEGGGVMFESFDRPVRCSAGHLFTTIWIPLVSFKAIRLGWLRFQYCPVGHHWANVTPLDPSSTSPEDLRAAAAVHDVRIP